MLTGSFASAYYGALRSTQDIDLVISATQQQLRHFIESLPNDEYYADVEAALEAHKKMSMFNVIDMRTGWKIDMIILKNRAFSREEFLRRQLVRTSEASFFVATAEDVILAKLEWAKGARSNRQIQDAAGIVKIRGEAVDFSYLKKWISELNLEAEWNDVQRAAATGSI